MSVNLQKLFRINSLLALLLCSASIAIADPQSTPRVQQEAESIYATIMSPYCPGRTLSACPSEDARNLRTEIFDRLSRGEQPAQVRAELVSRFGESVFGFPITGNMGQAVWWIPALFFIIGGLAVVLLVRAMLKRAPTNDRNGPEVGVVGNSATGNSAVGNDYSARVEEELQRRLKS